MSYCRFTTGNTPAESSDVYVYESPQGFEVHVATARLVPAEPLPELNIMELTEIDHDAAKAGDPVEKAKVEDWLARDRERHRILEQAQRVHIGGPYDGASFTHDEPGQAASALRHLRAAGYLVPAGVIEELDAEQDELEAAETDEGSQTGDQERLAQGSQEPPTGT